jgi:hypothetical protein
LRAEADPAGRDEAAMIDLDDIGSLPGDLINSEPQELRPPLGLIVAAPARPGELEAEAEAFKKQIEGTPVVIFEEQDPETGEVIFANGADWAKAMGRDTMPTVEECLQWRPR